MFSSTASTPWGAVTPFPVPTGWLLATGAFSAIVSRTEVQAPSGVSGDHGCAIAPYNACTNTGYEAGAYHYKNAKNQPGPHIQNIGISIDADPFSTPHFHKGTKLTPRVQRHFTVRLIRTINGRRDQRTGAPRQVTHPPAIWQHQAADQCRTQGDHDKTHQT